MQCKSDAKIYRTSNPGWKFIPTDFSVVWNLWEWLSQFYRDVFSFYFFLCFCWWSTWIILNRSHVESFHEYFILSILLYSFQFSFSFSFWTWKPEGFHSKSEVVNSQILESELIESTFPNINQNPLSFGPIW